MRFPIPSLCVGLTALLTVVGLAAPAAAGEVVGTVSFDGVAPRMRPIPMDADPQCAAKHDEPVAPRTLVLGPAGTLGNVFVQVVGVPSSAAGSAPTEPVVVDQVGCLYEPRVVGVRAGQPLLFKNSDGIFHNVHLKPAKNPEANVAMPPFLKEKQTVLSAPELYVPVSCDVHPWMKAYVAVMEHPFFDVTADDGAFSIGGLPAGTYTVRAWHEKLGTQESAVEITADGSTRVDFALSRP